MLPAFSRVPGLKTAARLVASWLPGGGRRLAGDGEDATDGAEGAGQLRRIARAPDGKFVVMSDSARSSVSSSSDDGGFLTWRASQIASQRAAWRRPLVASPSLSLRSDGTGQSLAMVYTPRLAASSPSHSHTPLYISDLSSVPVPGSAELRSVHERYSQELPSLRAIHTGRFFVPVQPSPRGRQPRQVRSAPDLSSGLLMETSPESRSSSSGFGSKNTSSQQNQSSQSGSTTLTQPRIFIPPDAHPRLYIPPHGTTHAHLTPQSGLYIPPHITPPPPLGDWLDLTPTAAEVSPASVDIHYEFDAFPSTPTPPMTSYPPAKRARIDNIEARVAAMKAEFRQFRLRQEKRRRSEELESVC